MDGILSKWLSSEMFCTFNSMSLLQGQKNPARNDHDGTRLEENHVDIRDFCRTQ